VPVAAFAYTPYHLLLSLSWEEQHGAEGVRHAVVGDAAFPDGVAAALEAAGRRARSIPGRLGLGRAARQLRHHAVMRAARRLAREEGRWDRVLVGTDFVPEMRAVHEAFTRRGAPGVEHIEDGIGTYLAGAGASRGVRGGLHERLWGLLYGGGSRQHLGVGRHPLTARIHALRPELITWKPAERLAVGPDSLRLWASLYAPAMEGFPAMAGAGWGLVLLPGPGHPTAAKVEEALLEEASRRCGRLVVKRHPRSTGPLPAPRSAAEVLPAPAGVPAEAFAAHRAAHLSHVVTAQSTAAYSVAAVSRARTVVVDSPGALRPDVLRALNPACEVVEAAGGP
jgi:hypothetical protein